MANLLYRYLLNSTMLPLIKKDAGGNLTLLLLIQNESPDADKEAKLMHASKRPFWIPMHLYWP